jgi:hypothetical protein
MEDRGFPRRWGHGIVRKRRRRPARLRAASGRQSFAGRRDIDIPILDFFLSGGSADPTAAESHAKARHRARRQPTLIRMSVQQ